MDDMTKINVSDFISVFCFVHSSTVLGLCGVAIFWFRDKDCGLVAFVVTVQKHK